MNSVQQLSEREDRNKRIENRRRRNYAKERRKKKKEKRKKKKKEKAGSHSKNKRWQQFPKTELTMECYATPWRLLRDSRILWHIVETSFAFGVILSLSLSLPPSLIALSFLSFGGLISYKLTTYLLLIA